MSRTVHPRIPSVRPDERSPLKPAALFAPTSIDAVLGSLAYDGPALTLEEMDAAIATAARSGARDR
jgi:hypothetical protein